MGGLDDTNDYVTFDYDRLRMNIFESMTTTTTIPSAKSISIAEIPLAAMAVGLQPYSER